MKVWVVAIGLIVTLAGCEPSISPETQAQIDEMMNHKGVLEQKQRCLASYPGNYVAEYQCVLRVDPTDEIARKLLNEAVAEKKRCIDAPTEIGMSEDQVKASCWGKPQEVNTTETAGHIDEQWIYHDRGYLYFHDGILTTKQESY